ncbi:DNA translocase FtsK [Inmirania thermothiophila]|uniref:DNA translocase FtsK n=1 Tax=Inmirania thermothiophila TaxID=1750597 RepID=A0A3N1Y0V6_9GAMM|nr:DNA translocase FtsK [Inmirania thermothiophila]ROR32148.1 DNA translocase FtsK [Inmirania thermothiophila]
MPQATPKRGPRPAVRIQLSRRLREALLLAGLALAAYLLVALATYDPGDPAWSYSGDGGPVDNAGGVAGAWFADLALYLLGHLAWLMPAMAAYGAWLASREGEAGGALLRPRSLAVRAAGLVLLVAGGSGLAAVHFTPVRLPEGVGAGGVVGGVIAKALLPAVGPLGTTLFLLAAFLAGVTLFTGLSWLGLMDLTGYLTLRGLHLARAGAAAAWERWWVGRRQRRERTRQVRAERGRMARRAPPRIEPVVDQVAEGERPQRERQVPLFAELPPDGGLPPLALLEKPQGGRRGYSSEELTAMSRQLELKLKDFGVEAEVVAVHPGPVITRFEVQPGPGVKVSRITGLAKDLARALSVVSVRVVEVIPGKSVIGLEVPNAERETVLLGEILRSRDYERAGSPVSLALGKDIAGHPVVVDLARMPHLLVAGTTGSGKSVALNAMLLSILYKASPEEVRLVLVDPKMLELSVYEGIPHLLAPVVTDMKDAANALRWCVAEMERRYRLMAAVGVRNLAGFNRKVRAALEKGEPLADPTADAAEGPAPPLAPMPFIVVVVDELADLMMVAGKKVEELIIRLAQKARASGIHLILATQRPSVDVITGLIKSNIPARIAFQVSSRVDSRTILDQMGAEQLLGRGDMLYVEPGTMVPRRVHGAFVSDQEVHRVVEHLRRQGGPRYDESVLAGDAAAGAETGEEEGGGGEQDPVYDEAVRFVTEKRRVSVSLIQRRFRIGYNRAARIVEAMEEAGVVGPMQSNGGREVLAPPPPEA